MGPTSFDEKTLQTGDLIMPDVCYITVSAFDPCVASIFVEDSVDVPACDMAQHSYNAASTMLGGSKLQIDKGRSCGCYLPYHDCNG